MHLTTTFVSSFQKTATTLCGRKVIVAKIAIDNDATCPECRKLAEESHESARLCLEACSVSLGSDHETLVELRNLLAKGVDYRSIKFL